MQQTQYFLFCRPGFEIECASEIQSKAKKANIDGYSKFKPESGYVVFDAIESNQYELFDRIRILDLIFTRQWFAIIGIENSLSTNDRITPLMAGISNSGFRFKTVFLETADTNEAKSLSPLCKKIEPIFMKHLTSKNLIDKNSKFRLHVCFLSTSAAYFGFSQIDNDSAEIGGIKRLRAPATAPSRSTLKLEEAFHILLNDRQRNEALKPASIAVDLGAAPGGWTWQLVNLGIHVIAVDNAKIDASLMKTGFVEHIRADGFTFKPNNNVDWMVCDIVEKPTRVTQLVVKWLQNNWCRYTIFNLKLPMKKRIEEVDKCFDLLITELGKKQIQIEIKAKQLYHDREEITVFVAKK